MIIYPAIDLIDGKCVRLVHGKENKMTIYMFQVPILDREAYYMETDCIRQ